MRKEKLWFTFVELVISIIILSILSLLGFISYTKNLEDTRDSQRKSDFSAIMEAFKLLKTQRGTFPYPTWTQINILNNWVNVALQWSLGKDVILPTIDKIPFDPFIKIPYIYSITTSMREFQIAWTLENWWNNMAILNWDYESVSKNILPTIVLAHKQWDVEINPWSPEWEKNRNKFVFDSQKYNLPYTFNLPYNPISDDTKLELIMADKNLAYIQKNSYKNCNEIIKAGKYIGDGVYQVNVYGILENVQCDDQMYPESCKEIYDQDPTTPSWVYNIMPKWKWRKMLAYCDMKTAWWWWTLVAKNWSTFEYKIWQCDFMDPPSSISRETKYIYWACDLWQKEILFWTPSWYIRWTNNDWSTCAIDITKTNKNECMKWTWWYQAFKILEKWGCMWIGDIVNLSEWSFWWKWKDFEPSISKNLSYLTWTLEWSCSLTEQSYCNLFDIYSSTANNNWIWQTYWYRWEKCMWWFSGDWEISIRSHLIFVR